MASGPCEEVRCELLSWPKVVRDLITRLRSPGVERDDEISRQLQKKFHLRVSTVMIREILTHMNGAATEREEKMHGILVRGKP